MTGRILLLLVSTATVAACARPTPPADEPRLTTDNPPVSLDATTTTEVVTHTHETTTTTTTTTTTNPPPHKTTTTTKPPPPPPKPPDRWALSGPDRKSASQVIGATLDSIDPPSLWADFCPNDTLCVKINYQLLPGVDKAENGCITKVDIPDPLHEGGTVTYVFRPCDAEPPTT